ncbi:hypothetical protein F5877DRAFT_70645 [Lentinula edodes]|nr:hypothetical protein F5877DRAFT_70645 [Lentinula edodes]
MASSFPCPPLLSSEVLVDDTDPRLIYSTGWVNGGTPGLECEGTTHGSRNDPQPSTVTFTFDGVGVGVFGSVHHDDGSPTSIYQLDDLPNTVFTFSANGMDNYRVPFYRSPSLDPGNHTLVMILPPTSGSVEGLWVDYVVYTSTPSIETFSSNLTRRNTCTASVAGGVAGSIMGTMIGMISMFIIMRWKKGDVSSTSIQGTVGINDSNQRTARSQSHHTSTDHVQEPIFADSSQGLFHPRDLNTSTRLPLIYNENLRVQDVQENDLPSYRSINQISG